MPLKRSYLVPETVQASALDCGPASLKSMLEGYGISASYGRLREACQTDIDGTSIDVMEQVACQLGLEAEQIMLPLDHMLLPESCALPALVVVRLSGGVTHFVVAWRRHGPLLQLMDPATGRRWITYKQFLDQVYVHTTGVPVEAWRSWAGSDSCVNSLRRRLRILKVSPQIFLDSALQDPTWKKLAGLDAGIRIVDSMVGSGGIKRGRQAQNLLSRFLEKDELIPSEYWSVRPGEEGQLLLRGAVLVVVRGRRAQPSPDSSLSVELAAALREEPTRPGRELVRMLHKDGLLSPGLLLIASLVASGGVMLEAVLFRGIFGLSAQLGLAGQRLGAGFAVLLFLATLLALEVPLVSSMLRIGRHLELQLRIAFLEKIPLLGDRYFQSRLKSDMSERSHMIHRIRRLPDLGGQFVRDVFELLFTAIAIAWLDPSSAWVAALITVLAVFVPLVVQPAIIESDLRARTHTGALCRHYMDALLGLIPIHVHGAQRSVRNEHGKLLLDWATASFRLQRLVVWVEFLQFVVCFGLATWLLAHHLLQTGGAGSALLLVYWVLNLPVVGQDIALLAWQYPAYRNLTLRLFEPLGALNEQGDKEQDDGQQEIHTTEKIPATSSSPRGGVAIDIQSVSVIAAGHTILENINLKIPAGTHIAIVGPSGAGKSSLVGILLGWWRPAAGQVLVDGKPLTAGIDQLRSETAWVDPAVHLWNRTFFDNLHFGITESEGRPMLEVIEVAELRRVLEKLPEGFQSCLGEGGALVSGGEGQRIRLARALMRANTRLIILDEPFRGLDRAQRRELLARARSVWHDSTVLCITHDVSETQAFDCVLVIDKGTIVENGIPAELASNPSSRYSSLLKTEQLVHEKIWSDRSWRGVRIEDGVLTAITHGDRA
jgi:ATP-binding cassette subfamily B protein